MKNRWYAEPKEPNMVEVSREGSILVIHVTDAELKEWCNPWLLTLVVNVLGKNINYRVLENKIQRDWANKGRVKIIDLPKGFYVVQFTKEEDYRHALFEGPWMVANHYLLVQRWRSNFNKSAKKESKVAVWVRIPELPLELYNEEFLKRLGFALGTYLKMDRLTSIHSKGQFACFCVEMDLAKPLTPQVVVEP